MTVSQDSGPTRRERERDRRRNEIIDAASRVFAARGYSVATMDAIASEAELSKGTLYLYFENKEALFLANASRMASQVLASFEAISSDDSLAGVERYRRMLESYTRIAAEQPEKFRALVGFLASNTELDINAPTSVEHREIVDAIVACMIAALERGMADGTIRSDVVPLETATQSWAALIGINLLNINYAEFQRRFAKPVNKATLVPGFIETFTRGLTPT